MPQARFDPPVVSIGCLTGFYVVLVPMELIPSKTAFYVITCYTFNYIINRDLIYGIPHASKARCTASRYSNKSLQ